MTIEDRLTKLENESRNWRRISVCLAGLLGVFLSCSDVPSSLPAFVAKSAITTVDTLRTKSLVILDDQGEVVGTFSGSDGGTLQLHPSDTSDGTVTLTPSGMGIHGPDCSVSISHKSLSIHPIDITKRRLKDQVMQKLKKGVELSDDDRKLLAAPDVKPSVVRIGLGDTNGGGMIELYNAFGKIAVSAQANKANAGAVYVFDLNGEMAKALAAP